MPLIYSEGRISSPRQRGRAGRARAAGVEKPKKDKDKEQIQEVEVRKQGRERSSGVASEIGGRGPIYRDIPEALRNLIEPVVIENGCELVDVEVAQSGGQFKGRGLLRITVDSPSGDGRVPIERCVAISREVETLLDASESMPGAYQLEVSSPGLDRVLGREKDFIAAVGQEVKLRTGRPIDGRKRFRGQLLAVDRSEGTDSGAMLRLRVDGKEALVPLDEVERANTIYEFTSADFAKASSKSGPRTEKRGARSKASGSSQPG